jgi:hypothetical protein
MLLLKLVNCKLHHIQILLLLSTDHLEEALLSSHFRTQKYIHV